jgi:hypothetical protein
MFILPAAKAAYLLGSIAKEPVILDVTIFFAGLGAPAVAYIATATLTDRVDLANAVASLVFAPAVATFGFLPRV